LAACSGPAEDPGPLPTRIVLAESTDVTPTIPASSTATATPTQTQQATATQSITATATHTATITLTPSNTITDTPSPTLTLTPTETPEPDALGAFVELALQATVIQPTQPPPTISNTPDFSLTYQPGAPTLPPTPIGLLATPTPIPGNCTLTPSPPFQTPPAAAGCPVDATPTTLAAASQPFERGTMVWLNDTPGSIYVLYDDGQYQRFDDTFNPATDPESSGAAPPGPGLQEPIRGFGKVWRENPTVQTSLGWALAGESGDTANIQRYTSGRLVFLPAQTLRAALLDDGTWQSFDP